MNSVYLVEAKYSKDYKVFIKFNTGESGEVDLQKFMSKYDVAKPLLDKKIFSNFYLDSWPTLAWKCGFDISPEYLYLMLTGKNLFDQKPRKKSETTAVVSNNEHLTRKDYGNL